MSPSRRAAFVAAALAVTASPYAVMAQAQTRSPTEHVIVIVEENHTFDNVFSGYIPRAGQAIWNLLSQDIIDGEGKPGRISTLPSRRRLIRRAHTPSIRPVGGITVPCHSRTRPMPLGSLATFPIPGFQPI